MSRLMEEFAEAERRDAREEFVREVAVKMISDDLLTFDKIAEYMGLSLDEVRRLAAQINR